MESTNVILQQEKTQSGILRLTLNDESRRNALSYAMLTEISAVLNEIEFDERVRVIVIAANGPAFCAGHDLKEISLARSTRDGGRSEFEGLFSACASVMQSIVEYPKPVIAEVATVATAAGCQLVASCDLAVAADTARFATPGVNIGLFCSTPMVALSRNVSHKHAMEMLLTGDMISADRAEQIGLVNRVLPAEDLTSSTMELAEGIAQKSLLTLAMGKRAFYAQSSMPLADAYKYTSQVMVDNLMKYDAKEGVRAFFEKRRPEWQDN